MFFVSFFPAMFSTSVSPPKTTRTTQSIRASDSERQKELFAGIDQRVQSAINEIVLSDDYDIILPRQAALYVGDLYDITRKVTEKLNMIDAKQ